MDLRSTAKSSSNSNRQRCRRVRECGRETDAAAFLRREQHAALEHFGAKILETHAGLDERQIIRRAHFVQHRSRRQRFHDASPALAIHNVVMQQQANQLMRGKIIAAPIHAANAVGIAIRHETNIMRMLAQIRLALGIVFFNRFGIDTAKQNIMLCVKRRDFAGRSGQQLFKATRADTKQCFMRKTKFDLAMSLKSPVFSMPRNAPANVLNGIFFALIASSSFNKRTGE